jgi:cupin fold WbuC family metalloprotein
MSAIKKMKAVTRDDLREVSEGIFYADSPIVLVGAGIIDLLKTRAGTTPLRRARVCAHPSPGSDQHDMLIASHRETYVAPHRHLDKSESFLILEGLADVLLFDESGGLLDLIRMGPVSSGHPFFYRMPARQYHALLIASEVLVFVESTRGPFDPARTENAPWAPDASRITEGRAYLAGIAAKAR